MTVLARRYARAAVSAAAEGGGEPALDQLLEGLNAFVKALAASSELRNVIANPALRADRFRVLEVVVKDLGLVDSASRLIGLLAQNDRLDFIDEVLRETTDAVDARLGRARARVRSAIPLSESQKQRISRALEKRFGRPVVLSLEIDSSIIGGIVCELGDATLDGSVRRQLELVRERLLG